MPDPSINPASLKAESRVDWTPELRARLTGLHFAPARETEVVEELSQHVEDRWREMVAGGTPPEQATRLLRSEIMDTDLLARRLAPLRQAHRVEPVTPGVPERRLFRDVWQDLRYAVRSLGRQPGFALAAIVTLALGIGANTAIFSLVNATFLRRAPVTKPDELVYVYNGARTVFSYPAYAAVRDQNDVMSDVVASGDIQASLNVASDVDLVGGLIVSGNYFETLGLSAALGRVIQRTDDVTPMGHPVVVISHGLWQRRFGASADVLGRQLLLNGQPFSVVGVLGPDFRDVQPEPGSVHDLFVPMMMQPLMRPPRAGYSGEMNPDLLGNPNNGWLSVIGRLKQGVTFDQATASLTVLAVRLDRARRGAPPPANVPQPRLPIERFTDGDRGLREFLPVARLLQSVVGTVLLIACANVANLLLSRAASRRREIALRLAMGASRWRLIRQLLTESFLLAGLGGLVGVGLAWALVRGLGSTLVRALPFTDDFSMDGRVLLFAVVVSLLTGVVFGLVPALSGSRPSLLPALKDGPDGAASTGRRAARLGLKRGLVVLQVTLSLVLLVTAGLLVRSLAAAEAVDPGFDVDRLISGPLNINLLRYTRVEGREFYRRVIDDVSHVPGIESAALARVAVATGGSRVLSAQVEGRGGPDNRFQRENSGGGLPAGNALSTNTESVAANVVSMGFFRTLGIPLLKGRDFSAGDAEGSPLVTIVNQTMVKTWFPTEDPIGRRVSFDGNKGPWVEIVGIVSDSTYRSLSESPLSVVYLPLSQRHETGMTLYARASGRPSALVGSVRSAVQAIEPNLPMPELIPVAQTVGVKLSLARAGAAFIAGFGALALVLAAVGIYGVLAFSMTQREREFGVRIALGATRRRVFSLVIREGMWLVAIGTLVGLTLAAFGTRLLQTFLFGVSPTDTWTFATVAVLLAMVALAACVIPARRAMRVDPMGVLRGN